MKITGTLTKLKTYFKKWHNDENSFATWHEPLLRKISSIEVIENANKENTNNLIISIANLISAKLDGDTTQITDVNQLSTITSKTEATNYNINLKKINNRLTYLDKGLIYSDDTSDSEGQIVQLKNMIANHTHDDYISIGEGTIRTINLADKCITNDKIAETTLNNTNLSIINDGENYFTVTPLNNGTTAKTSDKISSTNGFQADFYNSTSTTLQLSFTSSDQEIYLSWTKNMPSNDLEALHPIKTVDVPPNTHYYIEAPSSTPGMFTYTLKAYSNKINAIANIIYPIGAIYISSNSTSPTILFGGEWESIGQGRTLIGAGASPEDDTIIYTAGQTGGSKNAINVTHRHRIASDIGDYAFSIGTGDEKQIVNGEEKNVPTSITRTQKRVYTSKDENGITYLYDKNGSHMMVRSTDSTGESGINKNMQPYLVVYIWRRKK